MRFICQQRCTRRYIAKNFSGRWPASANAKARCAAIIIIIIWRLHLFVRLFPAFVVCCRVDFLDIVAGLDSQGQEVLCSVSGEF